MRPQHFLSAAQATRLDQLLMGSEYGFSTDQLMELAGLAVAQAVQLAWPEPKQRVLVVCGPGNNGGDGLVAARHLWHAGYTVEVLYPKRKAVDLYERLVRQLSHLPVRMLDSLPDASPPDIVVDAVFGYSFQGDLREPFDTLLPQLRDMQVARVCAVDVPSGWHVEKGDVHNLNWHPEMLVSLTAPKECAKHFRGSLHYIGGRFVPPAMAKEFDIEYIGEIYEGTSQVALMKQ